MKEWINFHKKQLLSKVGEKEIFRRYLNRDPDYLGKVTNPLRVDNHPGCSFSVSPAGRLFFNDFAIEKSYDCFAVVMEKYGVSFWEAIKIIEKDFHTGLLKPIEKVPEVVEAQTKKELTYTTQDFTEVDLAYWANLGISKETLIEYDIVSIKEVFVDKELKWAYSEDNPIFGYKYSEKIIKCYRPFEQKGSKFKGNSTKNDVAFYYKMPFSGKLLIITKSFKDALLLNNLGYYSVAPNAEGIKIDTPKFRALKMTFDNTVLFYDNDEPGIEYSKKRAEELDIPYILIPKKYKVKDISDFYLKYGEEDTRELLKKLINDNITSSNNNPDGLRN